MTVGRGMSNICSEVQSVSFVSYRVRQGNGAVLYVCSVAVEVESWERGAQLRAVTPPQTQERS